MKAEQGRRSGWEPECEYPWGVTTNLMVLHLRPWLPLWNYRDLSIRPGINSSGTLVSIPDIRAANLSGVESSPIGIFAQSTTITRDLKFPSEPKSEFCSEKFFDSLLAGRVGKPDLKSHFSSFGVSRRDMNDCYKYCPGGVRRRS